MLKRLLEIAFDDYEQAPAAKRSTSEPKAFDDTWGLMEFEDEDEKEPLNPGFDDRPIAEVATEAIKKNRAKNRAARARMNRAKRRSRPHSEKGMVYRKRRYYKRRGRSNYWRNKFYKLRKVGIYGDKALTDETTKMFGESWDAADPQQKRNRNLYGWSGAGDYKQTLRSVGKWGSRIGGAIGGAAAGFRAGGLVGAGRGAREGYNTGGSFSRWMGWGDYTPISTNQIMGSIGNGPNQSISVNSVDMTGDIYLCRHEFVKNITVDIAAGGTSPFEIESFPINVGMTKTFPFGSQIAQNFEMYDFGGLVFQYKPLSGENSNATNNSLGKIMFATNYDPDAPAFINSIELENYDYANSTKPSLGMLHGVETAGQNSHIDQLYVRTGDTTKGLSFTDIGNLFVATEGIPGNPGDTVQVGELWVAYCVRVTRAQLFGSLVGRNIKTCHASFDYTFAAIPFENNLDPSSIVFKADNTFDVQLSEPATNLLRFTFPTQENTGSYMITYWDSGGVGDQRGPFDIVGVTNCQLYSPMRYLPVTVPPLIEEFAPQSAATATQKSIIFFVNIDSPGNLQASFDVSFTGAAGGVRNAFVHISQTNLIPSLTLA